MTSDKATVILVLDVSGSMQAVDVKPTRLAAAQKAIHTFLDKVPSRVRVGLVLFAGEAQVATPPTRDHELVGEAVDAAGEFRGFGGTAIGDAIATAVRLGLTITGGSGSGQLASYTTAPPQVSSTLVSILFLSDGRQTQGSLQPLEGAARARAAGFPVYTVALGTTGQTTLRGFPGGFPGGGAGGFGGIGRRGLSPDPVTLKAIATQTGGQFFRARSAGAVDAAYSKLGSSLGRTGPRRGDRHPPRDRRRAARARRSALGLLVAAPALTHFASLASTGKPVSPVGPLLVCSRPGASLLRGTSSAPRRSVVQTGLSPMRCRLVSYRCR